MSNRDNFTGGFLAGAFVGGLVGAAIALVLSSPGRQKIEETENANLPQPRTRKLRKRQLKGEEGIEIARRSLEDKIAQLNHAIDDVRHQLSNVNGTAIDSETQRAMADDV